MARGGRIFRYVICLAFKLATLCDDSVAHNQGRLGMNVVVSGTPPATAGWPLIEPGGASGQARIS
jgi:hypothetical protein